MTREELISRLERMVRDYERTKGRSGVSVDEAGMILKLFDEGKLDEKDLALAFAFSGAPALSVALASEAARNSIAGRVLVRRISYDGRRQLTIRLRS